MKALRESLFDKDIVKKSNVQIGELYELSDAPHHNYFSNEPRFFMMMFKSSKLRNWNYKFVDLDNNFIEYWEKENLEGIAALIDIILQMPAIILSNPSNFHIGQNIKNELKPYTNQTYYDSLYVGVRKIKDYVEISMYDDLDSSTPSSMKIMLKKK